MRWFFIFIIFMASHALACGPYFPSSYLGDYNDQFHEYINMPEELQLIAREYELIGKEEYPQGYHSTLQAEKVDFQEKATHLGGTELLDDYMTYAKAVRAGDTNAVMADLPDHLQEFTLYLEGTAEFMADESVTFPEAWKELLALDPGNRLYRTTWVYYMLGNLAGSHGMPERASKCYNACREADSTSEQNHTIGLAHASYKRDYLCQTNLSKRIERGIAAVGYYQQTFDYDRKQHCMDHLYTDMDQAAKEGVSNTSMAVLEAMALFNIGKARFFQTLENQPDLKISPRLAWFMYKNGEPEKAMSYLEHCPEDDILANWLRYRLAQRNGRTDEAFQCLEKWFDGLKHSNRILYQFDYSREISPNSALHGSMGSLQASQGQMMDAMESFVAAGAYLDAALIAERYLETNELKRYIDDLDIRASRHSMNEFEFWPEAEIYRGTIELRLTYLLARRLFREGRMAEALQYYPSEIAYILNTYLNARKEARSFRNNWNTKAAHLYHAARIMRWKGMELSGTELYPDNTVVDGNLPWVASRDEGMLFPENSQPMYDKTAPVPNHRFHYRHIAAELAGDAADQAFSRHQKAMMLWSAGSWIQSQHPNEADVYYKKLARLHFQPLGKAADEKRWFPEASERMDEVHFSENYIKPKLITEATKTYSTN